MSKADKMFKELGYKKTIDEPNLIYYERYSDKHMIFTVEFKEGEVLISNLLHRVAWAKPKLHLAIVEKIKELGWLDE